LAESLLPAEPDLAPRWSVAVMELGALVCTAERPRCPECPVVSTCAWHRAGQPADSPDQRRPGQRYKGTDRQCRGRLLAVLRTPTDPSPLPGSMPPGPMRASATARWPAWSRMASPSRCQATATPCPADRALPRRPRPAPLT